MNKEEWKDYKKLSGEITEKLDNTSTYESWLIIQEYIDRCQQKNKKYKIVIENIICEIKTELKENNHLSYEAALSIAIVLELLNKEE